MSTSCHGLAQPILHDSAPNSGHNRRKLITVFALLLGGAVLLSMPYRSHKEGNVSNVPFDMMKNMSPKRMVKPIGFLAEIRVSTRARSSLQDVALMSLGITVLVILALFCCIQYIIGPCVIGSMAKNMVNKDSKDKLGVQITVGSISVSPFPGSVCVQELIIHNPEGFAKTDYFMKIGSLSIELKTFRALCSCGRDIVIGKVLADCADCQIESKLERKGLLPKGVTNDKRIQEDMEKKDLQADSGGGVAVKEIHFSHVTGSFKDDITGLKTPKAPLPDIHINDASGSMAHIMKDVLKSVAKSIAKVAKP